MHGTNKDVEITELWNILGIKFSGIPKGRITSLSFLFASFIFAVLGFLSPLNIKGYFFMIMSFMTMGICIILYAGFIPCKERLPKGDNE